MRIGFYGGSFDPPHLAHLAVATAAATAFSLDTVLFAPTARQPLKPNGAVASFPDRWNMVQLLCAYATPPSGTRFEASSIDDPLPGTEPNYTIDTLARLRHTLHPRDTLFAILGADAFLGLPHWRDSARLLQMAEWIVVSRPGFPIDPDQVLGEHRPARSHVHLLHGVAEPVSATTIRSMLRQNHPCDGLLPPPVLQYIRSHHLYI